MDDYSFLLSPESSLVVLLGYYCERFRRQGTALLQKLDGLKCILYLAPLAREYIRAYYRAVNFHDLNLKFLLREIERIAEGDANASYLLSLASQKSKATILPKQNPQLLVFYSSYYELLTEDWDLSRIVTISTPTATRAHFEDLGLITDGRIFYKHKTNEAFYSSGGFFYNLQGFPVAVEDDDSLSIF